MRQGSQTSYFYMKDNQSLPVSAINQNKFREVLLMYPKTISNVELFFNK